MITQNSFLSAATSSHPDQPHQPHQPHQSTLLDSYKMFKIQNGVFNRIVDLKNEKIKLLTELSQCVDRRYQVESEVFEVREVGRYRERNLVGREQYMGVVERNVELKVLVAELERHLMDRTTKTQYSKKGNDDQYAQGYRAKTVYDLQRSKDLFKSSHSRSKNIIQNFKTQKSSNTNFYLQDKYVDDIIQQRNANSSLEQVVKQQMMAQYEKSPQKQLQKLKKRVQQLKKLIQYKQQQITTQKLAKSIRGSKHSKTSKKQPRQQKHHSIPTPSPSPSPSATPNPSPQSPSPSPSPQTDIKQLLRYIQQQQQQKKLLYQDLVEFQQEMQSIRAENEEMKHYLAVVALEESRASRNRSNGGSGGSCGDGGRGGRV